MEILELCLSDSHKFHNFVKRPGQVRDYIDVGVVECINCGVVIHDKDLRLLVDYSQGTMHSWMENHGNFVGQPMKDLDRRLKDILKLKEEFKLTRLLDLGCGAGEMLEAFNSFFEVEGLEPENSSRIRNIEKGFLIHKDFSSVVNHFEIVTLFHVIEHIYEPDKLIKNISKILSPGSLLVIETPNSQDALLTLLDSRAFQDWTYWSHHPILYSKIALENLLMKNNYEIIDSRGVQRYSLDNHLYWLSKGKPGGHEIWNKIISDTARDAYDELLEVNGNSDSLWVVARKCSNEII